MNSIMAPSRVIGGRQVLRVAREDIVFFNVAPGRVKITVRVHNYGDITSRPTQMVIQAAPLGAFLPWKPLATLTVPPIPPGEAVNVELVARHERNSGSDDDPPTRSPLPGTAVDGEGDDRSSASLLPVEASPPGERPVDIFTIQGAENDDPRDSEVLPSSLWEQYLGDEQIQALQYVLGQGWQGEPRLPKDAEGRSVHWAGNLNVFVEGSSVEMHRAQALRIYPSTVNQATFYVGDAPDEYRFRIECSEDWEVKLQAGSPLFSVPDQDQEIEPGQWCACGGRRALTLSIIPLQDCSEGAVTVHVTQRSTGDRAAVEFTFDASAEGPGCYML